MKKVIIISAILFLSNSLVFGQDEIRNKRFYLGAFVSPDYSGVIVSNNNLFIYSPKLAYTAGADFLYQVSKRISLSIGAQYSMKGYQIKNEQGFANPGLIYSSSSITNLSYKFNSNYIDIPLRIDIYLSKKKIAPFISTGISTNIYISAKTIENETYLDGHHATQTYYSSSKGDASRVNPQFQLGAGVDMALKKARIRIFPIYRMSVLSVLQKPNNAYFYSVGLGINYFFGL